MVTTGSMQMQQSAILIMIPVTSCSRLITLQKVVVEAKPVMAEAAKAVAAVVDEAHPKRVRHLQSLLKLSHCLSWKYYLHQTSLSLGQSFRRTSHSRTMALQISTTFVSTSASLPKK